MRITAGTLRGRTLRTVEGPGYRPATGKVREALFSMLGARGVSWPAVRVLDLFAGSGSLGFEALSRGAAEAWFVDNYRAAAQMIRTNARALGVEDRCRVLEQDLFRLLARPPRDGAGFEVVFIDPPYGKNLFVRAVRAALEGGWVAPGGVVNAEVEAGLDLDPASLHEDLEPITDRSYGQTRIVLWKARER
jgi:16S rRNA (guanine966-N2)-methyltransferase